MPDSHPVRAVLFDLDGTLLDTAPDISRALNALRREQALSPLPDAQVRPCVSHGATAVVKLGFPDVTPEVFESLRERLLILYSQALAVATRPFAGMPEVLASLEQQGIAWGVVTNKAAWLAEPLLQELQLYERAAVIVSGDTTPQRKPHPEPLLHAARHIGVAPAHCVYVGDAERDALAARAAGMRMLVALFGYLASTDRPHDWPAAGCIDTPLDILAWLRRATVAQAEAAAAAADGR